MRVEQKRIVETKRELFSVRNQNKARAKGADEYKKMRILAHVLSDSISKNRKFRVEKLALGREKKVEVGRPLKW